MKKKFRVRPTKAILRNSRICGATELNRRECREKGDKRERKSWVRANSVGFLKRIRSYSGNWSIAPALDLSSIKFPSSEAKAERQFTISVAKMKLCRYDCLLFEFFLPLFVLSQDIDKEQSNLFFFLS